MCEYQFEFQRLYERIDEVKEESKNLQEELKEVREDREKIREEYEKLLIEYNIVKEESIHLQYLLNNLNDNLKND
jgi:predicted  nucleic acid-binding Zn-ribbon protein